MVVLEVGSTMEESLLMACAALDQPLCTVTQQISSTELGMQPARCLQTRLRGARKSSVYVAGRNPTNKLYKTIEEVIVTVLYRSMTLFSYCGSENGVHKHVL